MTRSLLFRLLSGCLILGPLVSPPARAEDGAALLAPSAPASLLPPAEAALPPAPAAAASPAPPAGPDDVELAALYYYAAERQTARVTAETARLQAKYPGFAAPADLVAPQAGRRDESRLWALYEKDDFDGIERAIAAMRSEAPGYQPSADFTTKLARRKLRVAMSRAFAAKDWVGVIAASAGLDPASEREADLLFMAIDGHRAAGNVEALLPLYRAILFRKERLPDPALVTVLRKAVADFSADEVRAAMAALFPDPLLVPELIAVNDDLLRRDFAAYNEDDRRTDPLPPEAVARMAAMAARPGGGVEDAALLGWYYLKVKDAAAAEPLFRRGHARANTAAFVKGLYLSLAAQGKEEEAYRVAAGALDALRDDPAFLMNALSLRFARPALGAVDPATVDAYSRMILAARSAAHAEILAWYAYNSGQFAAAEAWFAHAYDWEAKEERMKGIALSLQRQNRRKDFAALKADFGEIYPALFAEIATGRPRPGSAPAPVSPLAVRFAASPGDPVASAPQAAEAPLRKSARVSAASGEAPAGCTGGPAGLSAEAARLYGWCALKLDRVTEAREAFALALSGRGTNRQDAAYGAGLAALRAELTDEAEAILAAYPMKPAQDRELRAELHVQRARAAFARKDYAATLAALDARLAVVPEPADLTELRGWSHYHLGRRAEARAIFARLTARFGEARTLSGLNAARETMRVH